MKNYVANLIGQGVFDEDIPVDRPYPRPVRVGDEGVLLLYGDREGGTVVVAAEDEDDAERRLVATFGDGPTIDDLQESVDQRPLSVAYTQGRVDDAAHHLLLLDHRVREYLVENRDEVEAIIRAMPKPTQDAYRATSRPHRTVAALDEALAETLADARPEDEGPKRYLDFRFDVTGLSQDEISYLWGEVAAQAERSEGHPSVEAEGELVDVEAD